jgi:hypothetical protein
METVEDIETTNILAYKSKIISTRKHTINIWHSASLTDTQNTHKDHVTWNDFL